MLARAPPPGKPTMPGVSAAKAAPPLASRRRLADGVAGKREIMGMLRHRSMMALLCVGFAAPAGAQPLETVKVGTLVKNAYGVVTAAETGDIACYLTMKDDR